MLSPESLKKIDREVAKYPADQKQSAVMAALVIAQDEKGWLAPETMDFVGNYLGMPPVAVYEVATFYNMYNLKPTGRFKLTICTCLPCGLQGSLAAGSALGGVLYNAYGPTGPLTLAAIVAAGASSILFVKSARAVDRKAPPASAAAAAVAK